MDDNKQRHLKIIAEVKKILTEYFVGGVEFIDEIN
jgi:hypothetical protein